VPLTELNGVEGCHGAPVLSGNPAPPTALESEFPRAVWQRDIYLELKDVAPGVVPASEPTMRFSERPASSRSPAPSVAWKMDEWPASLWWGRELLNQVTTAVEDLGTLVIQTRDIEIGEWRGFSIVECPYPVIAANSSDWHRPRIFTLLHDLVHLGLQAGGLCDLHEAPARQRTANADPFMR
jgi:hypothetical protein